MKKGYKITLIILGILIGSITGLVAFTFWGINTIFSGMCTNEIVSAVDSPTGTHTAYLFTRDCGATTSESYQLSILKKDKEFNNKSGNTFVSEQIFTLEWESDKKLNVFYPQLSETYEMDQQIGRVKVEYITK